ncbi:response regulator transcription factor [Paenibacillus endoradicis]|uniref:response regulator transcription factor n=1 Tax=Paenibacillus endoradicis TaxID=2972487 RepID=UPI0021591A7D|nr:response regulator [Paenibacillus endoradicis]MCR8657619.1 response regulator [Paenibacillus endoradicis]
MYKVLIVDDEIFVRKGIIGLMDWNKLQYEICGEAENGLQAVEMIEQLKPDLVIADIRMPILDGLALIKEVNEKGKHQPLFIIISGYHDFSYAQQALRYLVSDYILKPVDEKELEDTLRRVASTLSKKRLTTLTGEKPLTDSVIETLLNTECSEQDAKQLAEALHIPFSGNYCYVTVEVHDSQLRNSDYNHVLLSQLDNLLYGITEKVDYHIPIHVQMKNQFGLIIEIDKLKQALMTFSPEEAFRLLQLALVKGIEVPITIYVGLEVNLLNIIASSAISAKEAMNYKFAEDGKSVIFSNEVSGTVLYYFDVETSIHNNLLEQIEENKHDAYTQTIDQMFQQFRSMRFAPSAVANALTRCTIGIINIVRQMEGKEEELKLLPEMLGWQKKYSRLSEVQDVFLRFVQEASQYILDRRGEQGKGSIEKIKKYIDNHYTENINLKGIAAKFYMNSVYLGQLFRKSYGAYFNEYLLSIRVEEAKKLLRQTDMRMYEVAEKVGFQNADYFVTQFEKLEKMTPTDYRNKILGKK